MITANKSSFSGCKTVLKMSLKDQDFCFSGSLGGRTVTSVGHGPQSLWFLREIKLLNHQSTKKNHVKSQPLPVTTFILLSTVCLGWNLNTKESVIIWVNLQSTVVPVEPWFYPMSKCMVPPVLGWTTEIKDVSITDWLPADICRQTSAQAAFTILSFQPVEYDPLWEPTFQVLNQCSEWLKFREAQWVMKEFLLTREWTFLLASLSGQPF